jgi:ribosomal protein S7
MRKERAKTTLPDPRFNDQLVTRFVNNLPWTQATALKFYDAIDIIRGLSKMKTIIRHLKDASKRYASM